MGNISFMEVLDCRCHHLAPLHTATWLSLSAINFMIESVFLAYQMARRFYSVLGCSLNAHPGGLVDGLVQDFHSYSGIGGCMECCLTFENKQWARVIKT